MFDIFIGRIIISEKKYDFSIGAKNNREIFSEHKIVHNKSA